MTQPDVWARLAEPFSDDEVKQRPGRGGMVFSYVDARAVAQRLDDVLTPSGWTFSAGLATNDVVHGRLTLVDHGVFREDFGYPNSDNDEEPIKAATSDALKRCAVQFGIGRHLYGDNRSSPAAPRPHPGAAGSSPRSAAPTPRPVQSTTPDEVEWEPGTNPGACPVHDRAWKRNSRGWFCSGKNGDGSWCDEHPSQAWMAQAS